MMTVTFAYTIIVAPFLFITDLDNTLVGDDAAMERLNAKLLHHRDTFGTRIVYSTGRSRTSYETLAKEKRLITPDAVVTGVGTAIYFGDQEQPYSEWSQRLQEGWDRDRIQALTAHFSDLTPQPSSEQNPFKISFFLSEAIAPTLLPQLEHRLQDAGFTVTVIYSGSRDLDILPINANKGLAMLFLRETWKFSPQETVVCGDSGNDRALFDRGDERGIIVGNAMTELLEWHHSNPSPHRYLAQKPCAGGILEGLAHFGFL